MKKLEIFKDDLNNLYGLSCIENFLLYALKKEQYPYQYLFYQSFLHFSIIANAFINEKVQYAYFNKINRIQTVAENYKLIKMHINTSISLSFLDQHDCICVMVKPKYIESKYKTVLWREDHYILLSKLDDNHFYYLNDTPRDIGTLSLQELKSIFAGQVVAFNIKQNITNELVEEFFNLFISSLKVNEKDIIINISDFVTARDILGIHRILRKRIYEFCSHYTNVDFLIPYLNTLDKHYASLEYMRIRNVVDFKKINRMLLDIYQEDKIQMAETLRELERIK